MPTPRSSRACSQRDRPSATIWRVLHIVGPGYRASVIARAYPAAASITTTFGRCLLIDRHRDCDLHHVYAGGRGRVSFTRRPSTVKRTSTVSKSALAITEEHTDLADSVIGQLNRPEQPRGGPRHAGEGVASSGRDLVGGQGPGMEGPGDRRGARRLGIRPLPNWRWCWRRRVTNCRPVRSCRPSPRPW